MIITCKCGHWYNTKVKCPTCNTVASEEWDIQIPCEK